MVTVLWFNYNTAKSMEKIEEFIYKFHHAEQHKMHIQPKLSLAIDWGMFWIKFIFLLLYEFAKKQAKTYRRLSWG